MTTATIDRVDSTEETAPKTKGAPKRSPLPSDHESLANVARNDEGRLTALPSAYAPEFASLVRKDFASADLLHDYKAMIADYRSNQWAERAKAHREEAEEARGSGDPTKKKIRKTKRLFEQLEALKASLASEGIDVTDLLSNDED